MNGSHLIESLEEAPSLQRYHHDHLHQGARPDGHAGRHRDQPSRQPGAGPIEHDDGPQPRLQVNRSPEPRGR